MFKRVIFTLLLSLCFVALKANAQTMPSALYEDNTTIGCDNNQHCSAVIFYQTNRAKTKNKGSFIHDASWYLVMNWENGKNKDITFKFTFPTLIKSGKEKLFIDATIITKDNKKHKLKLVHSNDGSRYIFHKGKTNTINIYDIKTISLIYDLDKKGANNKLTISPILNQKNIDHYKPYKGEEDIKALSLSKREYLNEKTINDYQDKYGKPLQEECYEDYNNYVYKVDDFTKIITLCYHINKNKENGSRQNIVSLWKEQNNILTPIPIEYNNNFIDTKNITDNYYVDVYRSNNEYEFYAQINDENPFNCGAAVHFVYDGEKFKVVSYKVMPLCANIYMEDDWISLYSAPYEKDNRDKKN